MQRDTILAVWGSHQKTEQFSRSNNDRVCSELTSSFNIHYLPSHNPAMCFWGWWWRWLFCILDTILLCATGWFWTWTPPALVSGMLGLQVCATIADYNVLCFLFPFSCVFMCCAWMCTYMFCMYMGARVWVFICTCVQMLVLLVSQLWGSSISFSGLQLLVNALPTQNLHGFWRIWTPFIMLVWQALQPLSQLSNPVCLLFHYFDKGRKKR